jgi:hypothetical protein
MKARLQVEMGDLAAGARWVAGIRDHQPGDGRTETDRRRLPNREIAERLYLSPRTVEHHVTSLLRRTGAANRAALATVISPTGATPPVN